MVTDLEEMINHWDQTLLQLPPSLPLSLSLLYEHHTALKNYGGKLRHQAESRRKTTRKANILQCRHLKNSDNGYSWSYQLITPSLTGSSSSNGAATEPFHLCILIQTSKQQLLAPLHNKSPADVNSHTSSLQSSQGGGGRYLYNTGHQTLKITPPPAHPPHLHTSA